MKHFVSKVTLAALMAGVLAILPAPAHATGGQAKGKATGSSSSTKGGHQTNMSPSNRQKHQEGEASRQKAQDPDKKAYANYKNKGGKLTRDAWEGQGKPKK